MNEAILRGTGKNLGRLLTGLGLALLKPNQWIEISGLNQSVPPSDWVETIEMICGGELQLPNMLVRSEGERLYVCWHLKLRAGGFTPGDERA